MGGENGVQVWLHWPTPLKVGLYTLIRGGQGGLHFKRLYLVEKAAVMPVRFRSPDYPGVCYAHLLPRNNAGKFTDDL